MIIIFKELLVLQSLRNFFFLLKKDKVETDFDLNKYTLFYAVIHSMFIIYNIFILIHLKERDESQTWVNNYLQMILCLLCFICTKS